jgi:methyl-accepting chemotaxis protein
MTNANLEPRLTRLETDVQSILQIIQSTAQLQQQNQLQLNELNNRMHQMTMRVDAFVFESQRLFARLGERSERHDVAVDSLRESVSRVVSTLENTNQRLGDVIDYLRRENP